MRLKCPTCVSVLEVPDGTTAMVRCPNCRGVFEASKAVVKPREEAPRKSRRTEESEPRKKDRGRDEETSPFLREIEEKKAQELEEAREQRRLFNRAAIGCHLLWGSYALYCLSLLLLMVHLILVAVFKAAAVLLPTLAGIAGLGNWLLALAGISFILAGPNRGFIKVYGIGALLAGLFHGLVLFMVFLNVSRGGAYGQELRTGEVRFSADATQSQTVNLTLASAMSEIPTQFVNLSAYMTWIVYSNVPAIGRSGSILFILAGFLEVLQLILAMYTLMSLARAAGDEYLSYRCIRAGAVIMFVIAWMVFGMLGFVATMVETGALNSTWGQILNAVVWMGLYGFLALVLLVPMRRTKDVQDACESPNFAADRYR